MENLIIPLGRRTNFPQEGDQKQTHHGGTEGNSIAKPQPKTKTHHGGTENTEKIKTFLPLIFADKSR